MYILFIYYLDRLISRKKSNTDQISSISSDGRWSRGEQGRSREVGFIFIAAIRRDSTPGVVGSGEKAGGRRRWDNRWPSLPLTTRRPMSSAFSPFSSLSFSPSLLFFLLSALFHRSLLTPDRHCRRVSPLLRLPRFDFCDPRSSGATGCPPCVSCFLPPSQLCEFENTHICIRICGAESRIAIQSFALK